MFKKFLPTYKFDKLTSVGADLFSGANLIIFDLDNTLVFSETTKAPEEIIGWMAGIKNKYKCVCVSNSRTARKRAQTVFDIFGIEIFLSNRKKPSQKLFKEVKERYGAEGLIFVVGDRIFTDILFGNLGGVKTVLIKPLSGEEWLSIKLLRLFENFIVSLIG